MLPPPLHPDSWCAPGYCAAGLAEGGLVSSGDGEGVPRPCALPRVAATAAIAPSSGGVLVRSHIGTPQKLIIYN